MEKWTVFRKSYPQADEDICWEWEMEFFDDKQKAVDFANELEAQYSDRDWLGHRYYKSTFYAEKIDEDYIRYMNHEESLKMAASYILD